MRKVGLGVVSGLLLAGLAVIMATLGGCQFFVPPLSDLKATFELAIVPPLRVVVDGTASNADYYYWDFGDGTIMEGEDLSVATHEYAAPGVYPIILKAVWRSSMPSEDELPPPPGPVPGTPRTGEYVYRSTYRIADLTFSSDETATFVVVTTSGVTWDVWSYQEITLKALVLNNSCPEPLAFRWEVRLYEDEWRFRGAWRADVGYNANDVVEYGGRQYLCVRPNSGQPPTHSTSWVPLPDTKLFVFTGDEVQFSIPGPSCCAGRIMWKWAITLKWVDCWGRTNTVTKFLRVWSC